MTHEDYIKAKKDLKEKQWKLKHLTGSESFTQHMKLHIELLNSVISKYEECHHIGKPVLQHVYFETVVTK